MSFILRLKAFALAALIVSGLAAAPVPVLASTVDTLTTSWFGRTSRGGINQSSSNVLTGSIASYGDVWNASYVFDLAALQAPGTVITGARLELNVVDFRNDRNEAMNFRLGSYTGDLTRLMTSNFKDPTFKTDTSIYAAMMGSIFGSQVMPGGLGYGDTFGVNFDANGLAALNAFLNGTAGSLFAFAGSFGYATYQGGANQYLMTSGARLVLTYDTIAPVPLPASGVLLIGALAAVSLRRRQA